MLYHIKFDELLNIKFANCLRIMMNEEVVGDSSLKVISNGSQDSYSIVLENIGDNAQKFIDDTLLVFNNFVKTYEVGGKAKDYEPKSWLPSFSSKPSYQLNEDD